MDPENWAANATQQDGLRAAAVAAAPGDSADLPIPMGVVQVVIPNNNNRRYVHRRPADDKRSGNPGCATTKTYSFSTQYTKNSTVTSPCPYGNWKLYTGNSAGRRRTT